MIETAGIDRIMSEAIAEGCTPGAVLAFGQHGELLYLRSFGDATRIPAPQPMQVDTIFDLASLTKVTGTTLLVSKAFEEGRLDLETPLETLLPSYYPADKGALTLRQLLVHAAGLPPHVPLYREFPPEPDDPAAQRRAAIRKVLDIPLAYAPGTETRYSDLGMILIGDLLETLYSTPLDRLFEERISLPLELADTFFVHLDDPLPKARRPAEAFAATEECTWRGRLIRGQVHDENAYLLRGVAGHAGLFSTAADLCRLSTILLESFSGKHSFLRTETLHLFTRRQELVPGSSRALGWDTPASGASCGHHFSSHAFGHTGFTGTSIWLDPEEERFVVLLSNRVHPTRKNERFIRFRPRVHDRIVETLERS